MVPVLFVKIMMQERKIIVDNELKIAHRKYKDFMEFVKCKFEIWE